MGLHFLLRRAPHVGISRGSWCKGAQPVRSERWKGVGAARIAAYRRCVRFCLADRLDGGGRITKEIAQTHYSKSCMAVGVLLKRLLKIARFRLSFGFEIYSVERKEQHQSYWEAMFNGKIRSYRHHSICHFLKVWNHSRMTGKTKKMLFPV